MDIDKFLDIERRTGVKDVDIDDFLSKASAVEDAVRGLRDGSIDPNNMPKIAGIKTEEEKAEEERVRQIKIQELREKENALKVKRKEEEKERWWAGAEFFTKNKGADDIETDDVEGGDEKASVSVFQKTMDKYNSDYSRWNTWVPSDPTSLAEREEQEKLEEAKKNEEFERNNPEFCKQHMDDMKERSKQIAKKQESADVSRLKGNRFYKQKDYETALTYYTDSLKVLPYNISTLMNIAQVKIKLEDYEDAFEFLSRVLYLDSNHIKALSRKAFILTERGKYSEALECIERALSVDSENKDLLIQVEDVRGLIRSAEETDRVNKLSRRVEELDIEQTPIKPDMKPNDVSPEVITATKFTLMKKLLTRMENGEFTLDSTEVQDIPLPSGVNVFDACYEMAIEDDDLRVLSRTSGSVKICSQFFNEKHSDPDSISLLGPCLRAMALFIKGDRVSRKALLDSGTLANLRTLMFTSDMRLSTLRGAAAYSRLRILTGAMNIFLECSFDAKIQPSVGSIGDDFIQALAMVVEDSGSFAAAGSEMHDHVVELLAFYRSVSLFIKQIMFSSDKSKLSDKSGLIVPALAIALTGVSGSFAEVIAAEAARLHMDGNVVVFSAIESMLEALLGCSQVEILRPAFSLPLFEEGQCAALCLLEMSGNSKYLSFTRPLCYGLLMNLCISTNSSNEVIKTRLVEAGAMKHAIGVISLGVCMKEDARKELEVNDHVNNSKVSGTELSRATGLLSRLCTVASVAQEVYKASTFRLLCKATARAVGIFAEPSSPVDIATISKQYEERPWVVEEKMNLMRILSTNSGSLSAECKKIASEEKLVLAVLYLFPCPPMQGGQVTPQSVIIPPPKPAPTLLLGNAARCLMPYAELEEYAAILYSQSQALGIERLVNAMATCSDIRVRKNIAILLAKGCKVPGARERLTHFRGMEMIIELQSKF